MHVYLSLGNDRKKPKQLKMTIQQTFSLPGLYPPKHHSKATTFPAWSTQPMKSSARYFIKMHSNSAQTRSYTWPEAGRTFHTLNLSLGKYLGSTGVHT